MSGLFGSAIVEVAIGLFFLYWLLSIICSAIQEMLAALFKLRASDLERGIENLVCDPAAYQHIMAYPLIKAIGSTDAEHKLVQLFARSHKAGLPSYISSRAFSLALLDYLVPVGTLATLEAVRARALAMFAGPIAASGPSDEQQLGKLILSLIDREMPVQERTALTAKLGALLKDLPDDTGRTLLQQALDAGKTAGEIREIAQQHLPDGLGEPVVSAIDVAQQDLTAFRTSVESWFDETMEHVSGVYKRRAKTWIFIIALLIAIPVGADSLRFVGTLYASPALRDVIVAEAARAVAATPTPTPAAGAISPTPTAGQQVTQSFESAQAAATSLSNFTQLFGFDDHPALVQDAKDINWVVWTTFVLKRVFGSLLTAFAISMGAPFWFDILSKLVNMRSSGDKSTTADSKT